MGERVILYVEDEPDDIRIAELSFERLKVNYRLCVISRGREVIDRMRNAGRFRDRDRYPAPQIVLLDIAMPDMGGFEILNMLKLEADFQNIPVFMLTGSFNLKFREKAAELGAAGYIQKGGGITNFANSLAYMNTRLMANLKYDSLIRYEFDSK